MTQRLRATKCSRTQGKKGEEHFDPSDPPRCRANKRRGRGTYANDRPPILGVIGRETGEVRLRVVRDTKSVTLCRPVQQFTQPTAHLYTDEYASYNALRHPHTSVTHATREWARDDDGDGIREVHTNTAEGMWAGVRTFLRPFRGVHKRFLAGYVAIHEFRVNLKRISVSFIAALVRSHYFYS
jgi:transposase